MELLILSLLFGAIGFILATLRTGDRRGKPSGKDEAVRISGGISLKDRWNSTFRRRRQADEFRAWVFGSSSDLLSEEFKLWIASLPVKEADTFTNALGRHFREFKLSLSSLISGSLEDEPIMRQVFVEAIVIYSQAYRKAKQAHNEVVATEKQPKKKPVKEHGHKTSEKTIDNNRELSQSEIPETVVAA